MITITPSETTQYIVTVEEPLTIGMVLMWNGTKFVGVDLDAVLKEKIESARLVVD